MLAMGLHGGCQYQRWVDRIVMKLVLQIVKWHQLFSLCTVHFMCPVQAGPGSCSTGVNLIHFLARLTACPTPCRLQTGNTGCLSRYTAAHRRISQMRGSQHLSPVDVSTRQAPSHASYGGPELVWATSFDVAGPRLWNKHKLPALLRSSDRLCQFRRQLKPFLFVKD